MYKTKIRETLAKLGRIGTNPSHVEAWMRAEFGTLDGLSNWKRAVREAADCVAASTQADNDALCASYGIR